MANSKTIGSNKTFHSITEGNDTFGEVIQAAWKSPIKG
jgi:hypothetical protein